MSLFLHTPPTGRTAAIAAGLTSYDSRRRCPISGHGTLRRPRDGKCCACLQQAKDLQAATGEKLYQAALVRARAEVVREQRREAKRVADEALKAEKAALRVQAQADRDKAKRAKLKAARAAQKAQEAAEAVPVGSPAVAPVAAPVVAAVGSLGVPPWEEVSTADYSDTACPWDDSPPWD